MGVSVPYPLADPRGRFPGTKADGQKHPNYHVNDMERLGGGGGLQEGRTKKETATEGSSIPCLRSTREEAGEEAEVEAASLTLDHALSSFYLRQRLVGPVRLGDGGGRVFWP